MASLEETFKVGLRGIMKVIWVIAYNTFRDYSRSDLVWNNCICSSFNDRERGQGSYRFAEQARISANFSFLAFILAV